MPVNQEVSDAVADAYDQLIEGSKPTDDGPEAAAEPEGTDENGETDDGQEAADDGDEAEFTADEDDGGDGDEPDDEEDGTDDDEDEESDEDDGSSPVVEVSDDTVLKLEDGTEIKFSEAALRQKDYTQKTQQLANERRQLEDERTEFEGQREKVQEFVQGFDSDPTGTLTRLVTATNNPTLATAHLIKQLADGGHLDEEFARVFVGENATVRKAASDAEEQQRLDRLEREFENQRQQTQAERDRQETVAQFGRQWTAVVDAGGLEFESPEAEQQLLRTVLQHAVDRKIPDLETAYADYVWRNPQSKPATDSESESQRAAKAQQTKSKKRAAQAMTPRSAAAQRSKPAKPASTEQAVRESLDAILARRG